MIIRSKCGNLNKGVIGGWRFRYLCATWQWVPSCTDPSLNVDLLSAFFNILEDFPDKHSAFYALFLALLGLSP